MFNILLKGIKNIFIHIRSSIKIILMILISAILIISVISAFYKPTYSVTLNGEFIGYTNDKNDLQKSINEYMKGKAEENIAFIDIQTLPEYSLCFVKREQVDNTNEILEKVKKLGTTYYQYYAISLDNEEKYYVPTKEDAEAIIDALKKKNSNNIDKIAYTQVYNTELKEYSEQDTVVAGLYEKKVYYYEPTGGLTVATSKIELGIDLIKPVSSYQMITSRFGQRASGMHKGLDIAAVTGTPIVAAAAGTVTYSGYSNVGFGECVIISHGNGVETLYAHCSARYVTVGQTVAQGETIGAVGSTGNSTGPHLHLEVRVNGARVNPQYYVY